MDGAGALCPPHKCGTPNSGSNRQSMPPGNNRGKSPYLLLPGRQLHFRGADSIFIGKLFEGEIIQGGFFDEMIFLARV